MALSGVYMTDVDGNIGVEKTNITEKVSGLLFDISAQTDIWTTGPGVQLAEKLKDTVVEVNSLDDVKELGLKPRSGETGGDFLNGIAYYHIEHFFKLNGGSGRLFIAFADCSESWDALINMQQEATGAINQFGVWTEQSLWRETDAAASTYALQIVDDIQLVANKMANTLHAPAVFVLNANTAKVKTATGTSDTVTFSKLPSTDVDCRYVSVSLGQALDSEVNPMQVGLESKTPVGNIGAVMGLLSLANVADNIGCVMDFDLSSLFPDIEFGFGDCAVVNNALTNSTRYTALSLSQLEKLHELGYMFMMKHAGMEGGIYFNSDPTCSTGDYRTISNNRVINKSRRLVRQVLLPYVNYKVRIDPATGQLSSANITMFKNLVTDVLNTMVSNEEISGIGTVTIPAKQNILKNDMLMLHYSLVPMGHPNRIEVTEGLVLTQTK